jgi:hypothetical protein
LHIASDYSIDDRILLYAIDTRATYSRMDEFSNPADSKSNKPLLAGPSSSGTPNALPKTVIKNVDMEESMQEKALALAYEGLQKYSMEKEMAESLKREFDRLFGVTWHCVVGKK